MADYLSGIDSIQKAIQLRDELICVMERAGISLQKWLSNEPYIIKDLSECRNFKESMFETMKILGLHWNVNNDMLQYKIKKHDKNASTNKWSILTETAVIFDLLSLIELSIVKAKLIIQSL